jgi:hypothetical protein
MNYVYTFGVCSTVAPPTNCLKADGTSRVVPPDPSRPVSLRLKNNLFVLLLSANTLRP